jgi:hypothetical protein
MALTAAFAYNIVRIFKMVACAAIFSLWLEITVSWDIV